MWRVPFLPLMRTQKHSGHWQQTYYCFPAPPRRSCLAREPAPRVAEVRGSGSDIAAGQFILNTIEAMFGGRGDWFDARDCCRLDGRDGRLGDIAQARAVSPSNRPYPPPTTSQRLFAKLASAHRREHLHPRDQAASLGAGAGRGAGHLPRGRAAPAQPPAPRTSRHRTRLSPAAGTAARPLYPPTRQTPAPPTSMAMTCAARSGGTFP